MKFSLFSDFHRYPGYFYRGNEADLSAIQKRAEENNVDFIIHAGDFCHVPVLEEEFVRKYTDFHIPSYVTLGNHDTDNSPLADVLRVYQLEKPHYFFDCKGYRFIICDPNYFYQDGEYIHYAPGNGPLRKVKDCMPPWQLKWLEEAIASAPHPCVLISHQSFEREVGGVRNWQEVRQIINDANRRKPHSVILCINGHEHKDNIRIIDNVCYFEINSTQYDWIDHACEGYPEDLCAIHKAMAHTLLYNDPIHAIVTLEGTTITIEGMESSMYMGVRAEDTDNPIADGMGRLVTPRVQSAKITLG